MRGWFVLTFMEKEGGEAWFLFCVDIMKKLVFRLRFCDSMNVYRWITSDCDKTLNTVDGHYFKIVTIGNWIVIIENWWSHFPGLLSWSCRGPGPFWCLGCSGLFPGNIAGAGGQVSCVPHGSGSLKLWHCALNAHCHENHRYAMLCTAGTERVMFATLERVVDFYHTISDAQGVLHWICFNSHYWRKRLFRNTQ